MKLILDALSYPLDIIMFDKINLFGPTISIQHVKTILCASKSIINDVFQLFFKYFNQLYKCANVKKSVLWVNFLKKDKTQRQCYTFLFDREKKREKSHKIFSSRLCNKIQLYTNKCNNARKIE